MENNGNTAVTDETLREVSRMIEKLVNKKKKKKSNRDRKIQLS